MLNTIGTVISWISGITIIIITMIVYLRDRKIAKEGLILAVLGIILIGAPTIWNRVTITIGDVILTLDTLQKANSELKDEVGKLNNDKGELITQVNILKNQISAVNIQNPSNRKQIADSIREIDKKNSKFDNSSRLLILKIEKNKENMGSLEARLKKKMQL